MRKCSSEGPDCEAFGILRLLLISCSLGALFVIGRRSVSVPIRARWCGVIRGACWS